jgi:hypothetical protein
MVAVAVMVAQMITTSLLLVAARCLRELGMQILVVNLIIMRQLIARLEAILVEAHEINMPQLHLVGVAHLAHPLIPLLCLQAVDVHFKVAQGVALAVVLEQITRQIMVRQGGHLLEN